MSCYQQRPHLQLKALPASATPGPGAAHLLEPSFQRCRSTFPNAIAQETSAGPQGQPCPVLPARRGRDGDKTPPYQHLPLKGVWRQRPLRRRESRCCCAVGAPVVSAERNTRNFSHQHQSSAGPGRQEFQHLLHGEESVNCARTRTCRRRAPGVPGWRWQHRAGNRMGSRPEMRGCSLRRIKHVTRTTTGSLRSLGAKGTAATRFPSSRGLSGPKARDPPCKPGHPRDRRQQAATSWPTRLTGLTAGAAVAAFKSKMGTQGPLEGSAQGCARPQRAEGPMLGHGDKHTPGATTVL